MCGIVGVINFGASGISKDLLSAMRDEMVHRGPDGSDLWISKDSRCGLAHRRLSILDLSSSASQPMPNETGSIWITFNGEIYNHAALRIQLLTSGHSFRTDHSDTEVLIHGYEEWGFLGLLSRIEGDFAFGIYDCERKLLSIARDKVGVKPLYFSKTAASFIFASEIKSILRHPNVERDIDPCAMNHYLSFMVTPAPLTMFKGIYKMPAGTWLEVYDNGTVKTGRYYEATPGKGILASEVKGLSAQATEDFYIRGIRSRLESSVEQRMMSDVPSGVFLSGGVDSSAVTALMARNTKSPINTLTVGFKDHPSLNEVEYAREVARLHRTNHREVLINESDMISALDDIIFHQDEPLADWVCIPLYFVSRLARQSGISVVQVGEGADELFCGYPGYLRYLKLYKQYWLPFKRYLPAAAQTLISSAAVGISHLHPRLPVYADIIDRAAQNREHFWILSMALWNTNKQHLLIPSAFGEESHYPDFLNDFGNQGLAQKDSYEIIKSYNEGFDSKFPDADSFTRMLFKEFRLRLPELLLMRIDKMGMAFSLEARVPFLDQSLVDFCFDIPGDAKIFGGETKYLLKKAIEGLVPDHLIYRKKMGFDAPMLQWLQGDFGVRVEREILSSGLMGRGFFDLNYINGLFATIRSNRANVTQQIWSIYNLVRWYDHWIDGRESKISKI